MKKFDVWKSLPKLFEEPRTPPDDGNFLARLDDAGEQRRRKVAAANQRQADAA